MKYDLTGQKIGDWLVIEEGEPYSNKCNKYTRRKWRCKCTHKLRNGEECGNIVEVLESNLISGDSCMCKICARTNREIPIKSGMIFDNWKVLEETTSFEDAPYYSQGKYKCECQCPLKTIKILTGRYLQTKIKDKYKCCGRLGCNKRKRKNDAEVDKDGNIISRRCIICGEMKPIDRFRNYGKQGWKCLDCNPYIAKKTQEQVELHSRYEFYKNRAQKVFKRIQKNKTIENDDVQKTKNIGNNWFIITEQGFNEITKQPCFYCGEYSISERYHGDFCGIDRINNSEGYYKENIVPCCNVCNQMKMQQNIFSWIERMKTIIGREDEIKGKLNGLGINKESSGKDRLFRQCE